MNEAITRYMRMGTVHFMSYPEVLSDESRIVPTLQKLLADEYFSVMEIAHIKNPEIRAQVKTMFEHSDCTAIMAAQPAQLGGKLNPNSLDPAERKLALDAIKEIIDEAYEIGAAGVGIIAGKYDEEKKDEAFEILVSSCKELCEYAAAKGDVKIELEQFDFDIHNKLLIGPAPMARRLAERLAEYDNFGILVDLSHLPLVRETPMECLGVIGKYVTHAHIGNAVVNDSNAYLYGDFHPRFSLPNSAVGVEEVTEFLRSLMAIGYLDGIKRPIVSFEIKAWPGDDPEAVLAECKRMMALAWALL